MNVEGVSSLQSRYGFAKRKIPVHSVSKENNSSPKITRKINLQNSTPKLAFHGNPVTSNKTATSFSRLQTKNAKLDPRFGFSTGISNNNIRLRENLIQLEKRKGKFENSSLLFNSESDNISSSDNSQDSDNCNSDISTSDSSSNNNIRSFSQVSYRSSSGPQNATNHLDQRKRVNAANSEGFPSSPKPSGKFLKKPGSGPVPYKPIGTRASKPIVTADTSETTTKTASLEKPKTIISSSSIQKFQPTFRAANPPTQLPGLRASFFNSDHQRLNSANLHNKPVNVYQVKKTEVMLSTKQKENLPSNQSRTLAPKSAGTISANTQKPEPSLRSFVQHRNRIKEYKIDEAKKEATNQNNSIITKKEIPTLQQPTQRKWVKKFEPKAKQQSSESDSESVRPLKGVECLSKLRSSNNAILAQHNIRPRLKSNNFNLPVIQQESIECDECNDDNITRTTLSPNETEEDSGIFTSSHSKYSLESLQEEKSSPEGPEKVPIVTAGSLISKPTSKMSQSWIKPSEDILKLHELEHKYSRGSSTESQPKIDMNCVVRSQNLAVINSSDSEELCSRETSPMQLLDELIKSSSKESKMFSKSNLGGIVKERKQKFESKIARSTHSTLVSVSENESEQETNKQRHFVDLKNNLKPTVDFSAISRIHSFALTKQYEANDKCVTQPLIDISDSSDASKSPSSSADPNNQVYQHILSKNSSNIMTTSTGSNYSNCPSETKFTTKTTPSPSSCSDNENKDFLIDDDYNDQQELTFYGHDDSLDESIFEKVDSLLQKGQEKEEIVEKNEKCQEESCKPEDNPDGPINVSTSPIRLPRLEQIIREASEKPRMRQDSLDTLSGQESIGSDDCMLDFEERQMQETEEGDDSSSTQTRLFPPKELDVNQESREPVLSDIAMDEMTQEVLDVKSMLSKLKTILLEAGTANPTQPSNFYANIVNAEADILLSTPTANIQQKEKSAEALKDVSSNPLNKAVEENQDLKRQLVFLQQQIVEKDRRIKKLESMVANNSDMNQIKKTNTKKNSASQI